MSDDLDNYDDDLDNEQPDPQDTAPKAEPRWRKRLEDKAKTATERADAAERRLAFHEAGLNPKTDDKRLAFFIANYQGDASPDAVKQAALDAGFIEADGEADDIPTDERKAHERIAATSTGGRSTGSFDYDAAIGEAKAAGQYQRVIELKQAQVAANRSAAAR